MMNTFEKAWFLKGVDMFAEMPVEELLHLAEVTVEERLEKGMTIYHEDDPLDSLFFVVKGAVQLTYEGKPITKVAPGQLFGIMAMVGPHQRHLAAVTLDHVCTLKLRARDFEDVLMEYPEMGLACFRFAARTLFMAHQVPFKDKK